MESVRKLKILAGVYLSVLLVLLLCVCMTPLVIQHGISTGLPHKLIIEEETLETLLIVTLFGISFLLLRGFMRTLKTYRLAADQVAEENATLLSRLAEAFTYIGTVNVEIHEIQSVLCGIDGYPQSKKEFKRCLDRLTVKAMAIAGTPWIAIRVIDRGCGRTIKEHAVERQKGALPLVTMGNRDILDGRRVEGFETIRSRQKNLDLLTVCILPNRPLSEAERVLLTAILKQVEMLLLLDHAGCITHSARHAAIEKEVRHDSHH